MRYWPVASTMSVASSTLRARPPAGAEDVVPVGADPVGVRVEAGDPVARRRGRVGAKATGSQRPSAEPVGDQADRGRRPGRPGHGARDVGPPDEPELEGDRCCPAAPSPRRPRPAWRRRPSTRGGTHEARRGGRTGRCPDRGRGRTNEPSAMLCSPKTEVQVPSGAGGTARRTPRCRPRRRRRSGRVDWASWGSWGVIVVVPPSVTTMSVHRRRRSRPPSSPPADVVVRSRASRSRRGRSRLAAGSRTRPWEGPVSKVIVRGGIACCQASGPSAW